MQEKIIVLDHPVYGLQPDATYGFIKFLFFNPNKSCTQCTRLGIFETDFGDWRTCIHHILPQISGPFGLGSDGTYFGKLYYDYWFNLYSTAIKKFLHEYPELALEE